MASSEALRLTRKLIFFVLRALRVAELPQFALHIPWYRAVLRTPAARLVAPDCFFTSRIGLRHLRSGSATAISAQNGSRFTRGWLTGLQGSLYATARSLASPSPTRTFTPELAFLKSPPRTSSMTTRATVNSRGRTSTGWMCSIMGCKRRGPRTAQRPPSSLLLDLRALTRCTP